MLRNDAIAFLVTLTLVVRLQMCDALLYSTTHITTGLTPITCSLSSINWAVPILSAGQSWGAGLQFNAATNLFTVDADTEYVVLSGVADFGTCPGSGGVCYGSGTFTNTFQLVDQTTTTVLASMASVSSTSAQYMFSAPEQQVQSTVVIPSGHSFGLVFFTNFCNWVNWSKSLGLTIAVYKSYNAPSASPVSKVPSASPVSKAPSASPLRRPSAAPVTKAPSRSPYSQKPSKTPTAIDRISTTQFTTGLTPITCSLSGINWAVPVLNAGQSWGAGLHFDATTNLFTVDADAEFIIVSGVADFGTCPGSGGVCYGSGTFTNTFQLVDQTTTTVLASMASVSSTSAQYMFSAPEQQVQATVAIPSGHSFGLVFFTNFCNWVGTPPHCNPLTRARQR